MNTVIDLAFVFSAIRQDGQLLSLTSSGTPSCCFPDQTAHSLCHRSHSFVFANTCENICTTNTLSFVPHFSLLKQPAFFLSKSRFDRGNGFIMCSDKNAAMEFCGFSQNSDLYYCQEWDSAASSLLKWTLYFSHNYFRHIFERTVHINDFQLRWFQDTHTAAVQNPKEEFHNSTD